jgi:hypothetical protein
MDLAASGVDVDDHDGVRRLTETLMATLTHEVETLRRSYPVTWNSR